MANERYIKQNLKNANFQYPNRFLIDGVEKQIVSAHGEKGDPTAVPLDNIRAQNLDNGLADLSKTTPFIDPDLSNYTPTGSGAKMCFQDLINIHVSIFQNISSQIVWYAVPNDGKWNVTNYNWFRTRYDGSSLFFEAIGFYERVIGIDELDDVITDEIITPPEYNQWELLNSQNIGATSGTFINLPDTAQFSEFAFAIYASGTDTSLMNFTFAGEIAGNVARDNVQGGMLITSARILNISINSISFSQFFAQHLTTNGQALEFIPTMLGLYGKRIKGKYSTPPIKEFPTSFYTQMVALKKEQNNQAMNSKKKGVRNGNKRIK